MAYIPVRIRLIIKELCAKIRKNLSENSVFYINGTDVLPPPLPKDKESECIRTISSGDAKSRQNAVNTLVEHNLRLVVYIAKRFENTGINIEDLISIGTLGLIKSINTFKNEKNIKLATYASRCIENEILMYIRKNAKSKNDVSLEEPLNVDWDGNELLLSDILGTEDDTVDKNIEEEEERNILRSAVKKLKERDRAIIEMRFGLNDPEGKEKTQKDVADTLGISQSYISRLEKRIIENLKKSIIGFYK
jgi:RNA polymerase sporulation-specific sigma factor